MDERNAEVLQRYADAYLRDHRSAGELPQGLCHGRCFWLDTPG